MTDEILKEREIEYYIRSWKLVPASGGIFNVTINDELVFSKKALNRHAEEGEIRHLILQAIEKAKQHLPPVISTDEL